MVEVELDDWMGSTDYKTAGKLVFASGFDGVSLWIGGV